MPSPDFAAIVPTLLLLIPPAKAPTELTRIPLKRPMILPLLLMPPPKLDSWKSRTLPPEIAPLLVMPPAKVETSEAMMAARPEEIVPLLVMPPPNVVVCCTAMPLPLLADIVPLLETWMPPEIIPPLLTRMPMFVALIVPLSMIAPLMVLSARTAMPVGAPEMSLLLRNPPLRKVLLVMVTPPAPIVPALVTPPLKVVALITIALV